MRWCRCRGAARAGRLSSPRSIGRMAPCAMVAQHAVDRGQAVGTIFPVGPIHRGDALSRMRVQERQGATGARGGSGSDPPSRPGRQRSSEAAAPAAVVRNRRRPNGGSRTGSRSGSRSVMGRGFYPGSPRPRGGGRGSGEGRDRWRGEQLGRRPASPPWWPRLPASEAAGRSRGARPPAAPDGWPASRRHPPRAGGTASCRGRPRSSPPLSQTW